MAAKPKLYTHYISPAGRAVLFTAHYLNIELDIKQISILDADLEQMTPEYLKLNPQHTVPVLNDNGVILVDSHAIVMYLFNKYDPNNALYPNDPVQRAYIDQRLYFDASISFPLMKKSFRKIRRGRVYPLPAEDIEEIISAYDLLETFLNAGNYVAGGENVSVADFFTYGTYCALFQMTPDVGMEKYPNIIAWMERMTKLQIYEKIHKPIFDKFVELLKSNVAQILSGKQK